MRTILFIIGFVALCSFSGNPLIKRISDMNFRYEFYTTQKKASFKKGRSYYWFKGGAIHDAEYGAAGELLHGNFLKYYHSNQLAEAGEFKNGLKEGEWKTWYENGVLQSDAEWDSGVKDGYFLSYDKTGMLVEEGSYKNGEKHGVWINYIAKDTLKYKRGHIVTRKKRDRPADTLAKKEEKPGFFKRLFSGKKDKTAQSEKSVKTDKAAKSGKPEKATDNKPTNKQGFFKRLFSKKDKNAAPEVKQEKRKPESKQKDTATKDGEKKGFFGRLFSKKPDKGDAKG